MLTNRYRKEGNFGRWSWSWGVIILLILNNSQVVRGYEIVRLKSDGDGSMEITTKAYETYSIITLDKLGVSTQPPLPMISSKPCAFLNVSDNSSYILFDREEFSEGLSKIHNSSDIYERFYSVEIEDGCEVTICELDFLNARGRVRKCFTSGTSLWEDLQLQNTTKTKMKSTAPDPIASQYFVSNGCSCKEPTPNCSDTSCENVVLEDNECGRLYKEHNCTQCRYDPMILKEMESFQPSNTYWCQSFAIRKGCRLSIDSYKPNFDNFTNVRNYSGRAEYVEMEYVTYPHPSNLTCICDLLETTVQPYEHAHTVATINWVLPIAVFVGISVLAVSIALGLHKCGVPLQIGTWTSQPKIEDVISKFQYGFTNEEVQTYEDDGNRYVSFGFLAAVQQPYQNKWEIPREKITIGQKPLGAGQFGVVFQGTLALQDDSETQVAIKTAKVSANMTYFSSILDEIKMLAFIGSNPNICCLVGACTQNIQQREALIVLELCSLGNLKGYLIKNKASFFESPTFDPKNLILNNGTGNYAPLASLSTNINDSNRKIKPEKMETLIQWCRQIACGMEYLGEKQVIHIDLAARNVLLTDTLECKIGDFGLSQRIHEVLNYVRIGNEYPLPFRWMALESLIDLKFTPQSDVWSYGVTVYEILSLGLGPFPDATGVGHLIDALITGIRLEKPTHCTDEIYQLMLQCWEAEPERRPSFTNIRYFFETLNNSSNF